MFGTVARTSFVAALVLGAAALQPTAARAQATRTWVSGVGDDANPCSRTAPCKTFAGAISKTAAGGEINCLDPGGFGAVTITKSITISCQFTEGGLLAAGNGIVVNAAATDVVYLRGLDLFGVNPPSNGVRFVAGGALHIEDCTIRRFNGSTSRGISFEPSGTSSLFVSNSTIADNGGSSPSSGGIVIRPGAAGSARVTLSQVRILNNANAGLLVDTTGSTGGGVFVNLDESVVARNGNGVQALQPSGASAILITLTNSVVANNSGTGILGDGAAATMRVGNTTISGNVTGVNRLNNSSIRSYGDNRLNGNTGSDGTFATPVLPKT